MTLVKAYDAAEDLMEDISDEDTPAIRRLLQYASLCCDGSVIVKDGEVQHIGDPTETSIVYAAMRNGSPKETLTREYPRLTELPFDSDRKLMTVVCRIDGKNVVITKGAFDSMLPICTTGDMKKAQELVDSMSSNASASWQWAIRKSTVCLKILPLKNWKAILPLWGLWA